MKMVSEPRTDCKTALRQVCTGRDGGARYSAGVCWYSVRPPAARREAKQGGSTVRSASSLMVDSFSLGRGIVHRDGFLFAQKEGSSMAEPIIQLKHLTKRFGGGENEVHALEDVSIEVRAGEIFGVIGLSGAGKSTLVRCINLLERPTAGEVIVDGRDMLRLTEKELRKVRQSIGMIFQSFNLLMQRTALDNICFPMELAGAPRREAVRRAEELLEIVDLAGRAGAYPAQLSGGQKQRVAIARTLATNPRVLLCDEATSALDPKTTRDILRLIQDINKRLGITVVVITHEMKVIEEICARVAILDHGHLAETGTVEEIFASPSSEAGRRLVYPDGVPEEVLSSAAGQDRVIRVAFNGGTSYQPLIATLAIDCGVKANILGADTRNIDGRAFGTMLLGLPREGADKAMTYIRSQKDITVEEVPDYHG